MLELNGAVDFTREYRIDGDPFVAAATELTRLAAEREPVPAAAAARRRRGLSPTSMASKYFDIVQGVAGQLPLVASCKPIARPTLSDREARELERLFKALADRHRVKILNLLQAGEVCVCDFMPSLGLSQPTVSYHLGQLLEAGLILRDRRGSYA